MLWLSGILQKIPIKCARVGRKNRDCRETLNRDIYNKIWNASQKIKLQLAGQQTLPFVRKTTKDVDNENLGK
jgi:hypothetical protein